MDALSSRDPLVTNDIGPLRFKTNQGAHPAKSGTYSTSPCSVGEQSKMVRRHDKENEPNIVQAPKFDVGPCLFSNF